MTLTEQTEMDTFLEEALATGRIRQSKSPPGALVFFIKKKYGKLRFVQDYQVLNAITRKNQYLLPLIDDLIHQLKDADNPNTTQTPEYTKDKYNAKIIK
jgi:hypothetical protein